MKEKIVNLSIVLFIITTLIGPAFADHNLNSSIHRHYIAKTYQASSAAHNAKNEEYAGFRFYISKINDGNDKTSDYNYIRIRMQGGTTDTGWTSNKACILTGEGERTATAKVKKETEYEFYTGFYKENGLVLYYYGNSSELDAYAYIRETLY